MAVAPSSIQIDFSRDSQFNDFSLQTLKDRYLFGDETSPQQAFARAAAAFADDEAHAQRIYDYVSKGWFMFATPVLSNGGLQRGMPISCFLAYADDSLRSISNHYDEVMFLSSQGGGIGGYWNLRSDGEKTSRGSRSTGQQPFISVIDRLILAVSQGGTRRGSYAAYVNIDHPEVVEFITSRKQAGGDSHRKILNLHNALNITDEFMEAVISDSDFGLRSPKTGEVLKTIKARELWKLILETRMQTGEPYLHFIDASNRYLPEAQKKLGLRVNQSNLCVTGDTEILTKSGFKPIQMLEGQLHEVWNGEEWSAVLIRKTSDSSELVRVWFEDGGYLDCTPDHKFYDRAGVEIRAGALKPGTVLEHSFHDLPEINNEQAVTNLTRDIAYTAGWTTFAGYEENHRLQTYVPRTAQDGVRKRLTGPSMTAAVDEDGMTIQYDPQVIPSGRAPLHFGFDRRKMWLSGVMDAAGMWTFLEDGSKWLTVGSEDYDLITDMRRMALMSGLTPRVRYGEGMSIFMLPANQVAKLILDNFIKNHQISDCGSIAPEINPGDQIVAEVVPLPWTAETFCATEPNRHRLTFNGYVTGNCTEITLPNGVDHLGKMRTAVCCLSSVNVETFTEWRDHPTFIEDLLRFLDNALQFFIDNAPPEMENARYSAMRERSVGLGAFGLRSFFQRHDVILESREARRLNQEIFRHLREAADAADYKLGAERGEAPDMVGTGRRFAHKLALAPNASSSIISITSVGSGASPATEPDRANAYLHKTLSGSFQVKNPYLKHLLNAKGKDTEEVWKSIVAHEGSVQHLEFLSAREKAVFRTAMEVDQRALIQLAADRGRYICQAQSVNLFLPHDADAELISDLHLMAWEKELKSLYYLRSTTPNRAENVNSLVERAEVNIENSASMSLNPLDDATCLSCEG